MWLMALYFKNRNCVHLAEEQCSLNVVQGTDTDLNKADGQLNNIIVVVFVPCNFQEFTIWMIIIIFIIIFSCLLRQRSIQLQATNSWIHIYLCMDMTQHNILWNAFWQLYSTHHYYRFFMCVWICFKRLNRTWPH